MKYLLMAILGLTCLNGMAATEAEKAAQKSLKAVTVFIDVSVMGRKNAAAKHMTQSHNEFAALGYELVDVSLYRGFAHIPSLIHIILTKRLILNTNKSVNSPIYSLSQPLFDQYQL